MLLTFINLVILAVQIYQINNKETAASVLWSVLTRFLRIAIICFQIVVFREWPFVTWLQAGVDWVLIIFEIMSQTVKNFYDLNKEENLLLMTCNESDCKTLTHHFGRGKIPNTWCPQQTLQLMGADENIFYV